MFSFFARGRMAPHRIVPSDPQGPIRLDEARFAAWALALGEVRQPSDPPAPGPRPHRGMLGDVDWSNAVPVPRRSLFRLVAALVVARLTPLASLGDASSPPSSGPDLPVPGGAGAVPLRRVAAAPRHPESRAA